MVGFSTVGAILLILVLLNYIPRINTMAAMGLSLPTELRASEGFASFDGESDRNLLGRVGTTVSPLRPGGVMELEGKRLTVVSTGGFVESDRRVRVASVEGMRIVVEPEETES
jgi:membrane-bound serine protease (ClpP class)